MMLNATIWAHAAIRSAEENNVLTYNPDDVTPGVIGFGVTALVALAIIFLGLDMYRRVRRMRFREEVRAEIAEELEGKTSGDGPTNGPERTE